MLLNNTINSTGCCASIEPTASHHLLVKPASGGTPIRLKAPTVNAPMVHGMRRASPLNSLTCVLCVAT